MHHDTAVLIGRFQPFHAGHAGLLERALATGRSVVVVLGSAFAAPSPRNPFPAELRERMIRATLRPEDDARVRFHYQRDVWDGPRWASEVRRAVESLAPGRTALVGFHKDASSAYLDTFPGWDLVEAGRQGPLDATPLREKILSGNPWEAVASDLSPDIPAPALAILSDWAGGPDRQELTSDLEAIRSYRARWGEGPFLTVDAVVAALDHVLLVRRGDRPGKGLLALPGGFLDAYETFENGARRELLEETGLDLGSLHPTRTETFAHPGRSSRARIVTQASLFTPTWEFLPPVQGQDDAVDARWVPIRDLPGLEAGFFGDHFHILDRMLGLLP
ncbi:MAG: NUDIX domain-containing protein [Fibrobacteria bacterium]|nr:NUDIX domain-containing protein [Fibrobacteria bacterium]